MNRQFPTFNRIERRTIQTYHPLLCNCMHNSIGCMLKNSMNNGGVNCQSLCRISWVNQPKQLPPFHTFVTILLDLCTRRRKQGERFLTVKSRLKISNCHKLVPAIELNRAFQFIMYSSFLSKILSMTRSLALRTQL